MQLRPHRVCRGSGGAHPVEVRAASGWQQPARSRGEQHCVRSLSSQHLAGAGLLAGGVLMVVSFMVCLQFVSCAVYMETARMLEGCRVGASCASSEDLTY